MHKDYAQSLGFGLGPCTLASTVYFDDSVRSRSICTVAVHQCPFHIFIVPCVTLMRAGAAQKVLLVTQAMEKVLLVRVCAAGACRCCSCSCVVLMRAGAARARVCC